MKLIHMAALGFLVLALAACEPQTPVVPQLTGSVTVHVHWADTETIAAAARDAGDPVLDREGYAVLRGAGETWACDVYLAKPRALGDATATLIGHEFLHCLYGEYHR